MWIQINKKWLTKNMAKLEAAAKANGIEDKDALLITDDVIEGLETETSWLDEDEYSVSQYGSDYKSNVYVSMPFNVTIDIIIQQQRRLRADYEKLMEASGIEQCKCNCKE